MQERRHGFRAIAGESAKCGQGLFHSSWTTLISLFLLFPMFPSMISPLLRLLRVLVHLPPILISLVQIASSTRLAGSRWPAKIVHRQSDPQPSGLIGSGARHSDTRIQTPLERLPLAAKARPLAGSCLLSSPSSLISLPSTLQPTAVSLAVEYPSARWAKWPGGGSLCRNHAALHFFKGHALGSSAGALLLCLSVSLSVCLSFSMSSDAVFV